MGIFTTTSRLLRRLSRMGLLALLPATTALGGGTQPFGVNVDIGPLFGSSPSSGYGGAAFQAGYWNNVIGLSCLTVNLNGLDGHPSGVTMSLMSSGNIRETCVSGFSTLDYRALMCDYQYAVTGVTDNFEYEFTGMPAGAYDVYTYACKPGDDFGPAFAINVLINGVSQGVTFVSGTVPTQTFEEGRTHDLRSLNIPAGARLTVQVYDTSGEFGDAIACNGFQLVRTGGDPVAMITDPTPIECVCGSVPIYGTANVPSGFLTAYRLEWSQTGNDPWNLITQSSTPVSNGLLGTWNTTGLNEGYYILRLTTQNSDGLTSTAISTVFLNTVFNSLSVASPGNGSVVGGISCFTGTIWDNCFEQYTVTYADEGSFAPVDPLNPVYYNPVTNDPFAYWDTTGVPDGDYLITVVAESDCDINAGQEFVVTVDNTPPVAEITSPDNCNTVCGRVAVRGHISDEHLESWVLQYTGGSVNGWVTIASGTDPVDGGRIAFWETAGLDPCCYTLRLIANDTAIVNCQGQPGNQTEFLVSVDVGLASDINGDGSVDFSDLNDLLDDWGNTDCDQP
ncbi:MAG: hypothetical protein KDA21_11435 [Phycisphaerales bacterium]|nr:hypothetical protein [Phycisphaerales bacterium]